MTYTNNKVPLFQGKSKCLRVNLAYTPDTVAVGNHPFMVEVGHILFF
jgi:hypothetical protein